MRRLDPARLATGCHYALSYATGAGITAGGSIGANRVQRQALVNHYKNQETS